ncbi:MAG: tripartite tricarboxylate transporter substrate binding protein [Tagaea sp.]|nr:tripartite tricarboxylate transporter substrate binding protein [Tagaea sp.]
MRSSILAAVAWLATIVAPPSAHAFPDRPVRVVIPGEAGGLTDIFARIIQRTIDQQRLLPQPLVIVNMPGAAGAVGIRHVKDAAPDGHTLLLFHVAFLTASAMGVIEFGPDQFVPVSETGGSCLLYAVKSDTPYQSLKEWIDAAKARPNSIRDATNIGAIPHFSSLMLSRAADMRLRYVQAGGGPARLAMVIGGHAEGSIFAVPEYQNFKASGIRALALLAPERDPVVPEVPTARELGLDVVSCVDNWWWMPRGTNPGRVAAIADVLQKVMADPAVRSEFSNRGQRPTFLRGAELTEKIDRTFSLIKETSATISR